MEEVHQQQQQINDLHSAQSLHIGMCSVIPASESPTPRSQPRIVNGRPVGIKPFNVSFDRTRKFPEKLWEALNDNTSDCLRWSDDGKSIIIEDKRFSSDVMCHYPGLVQIASFTNFRRQLREYGFEWYINNKCEFEFTHPCCVRGRPDLLENLQSRRKSRFRSERQTKEKPRGRLSTPRSRDGQQNFVMKRTQSESAVNTSTQVPVFFSPFNQPASQMLPIGMWQQANFENRQPHNGAGGDGNNMTIVNAMPIDDVSIKPGEDDKVTIVRSEADLHRVEHCIPFTGTQHFPCQYPCNVGAAPVWIPGGLYSSNCWYPGGSSPCFSASAPANMPGIPCPNATLVTQEVLHIHREPDLVNAGQTSHAALNTVPPERFQENVVPIQVREERMTL